MCRLISIEVVAVCRLGFYLVLTAMQNWFIPKYRRTSRFLTSASLGSRTSPRKDSSWSVPTARKRHATSENNSLTVRPSVLLAWPHFLGVPSAWLVEKIGCLDSKPRGKRVGLFGIKKHCDIDIVMLYGASCFRAQPDLLATQIAVAPVGGLR